MEKCLTSFQPLYGVDRRELGDDGTFLSRGGDAEYADDGLPTSFLFSPSHLSSTPRSVRSAGRRVSLPKHLELRG